MSEQMKLTQEQQQLLQAAAMPFSQLLGNWVTSLPTSDKQIIVQACLAGARLALEFTPQPITAFRVTLIAADGITRVDLCELTLPMQKSNEHLQ